MVPSKTMASIAMILHEKLFSSLNNLLVSQEERYGIDLSVSALFNGVSISDLPDSHSWACAYEADDQCQHMINMIRNPSLICNRELTKIDAVYRSPMRNSEIKFIDGRLRFFEPIADSVRVIELVIVPKGLRQLIFASFHVNPLGGHYSLYYTLHRIRLRFHWPGMYQFVKLAIRRCAACILKTMEPARLQSYFISFL